MSFRHVRIIVATTILLALSACASMPEQQAYNREAQSISRISVLEANPPKVNVFMLNHPGTSFGLIGGLVAAADQSSKEAKFRAIMEQTDFEPMSYLQERLNVHMESRGYALVWPESLAEKSKAPRGSFGLRKTYGTVTGTDAQMDINFGFIGYAAAGATDNSPYRPTATVGVRLVSADGKQNLYTDTFAYNNLFNLGKAVVVEGGDQHVYPGFDDLETAGTASIEGLKQAIDEVAAKIASQL